jgi:L-malate glycosyltransferase
MRWTGSDGRPRVLLLGDTLAAGGTEGQFVEVACGLPRARWDVRVACLRAEGPLRTRLDAVGVQVSTVGRRPLKGLGGLPEVTVLARTLRRERIDIVHAFDYYSNVRGVLAARLAGTRVIASQRDLGDVRPAHQRRLQRLALRLAHRVLVNSPAVADAVLAQHRICRERVTLVPNGIDLSRFSPRAGSGRPGRITIGTLGNLRPEKGFVEFVRAARLVRERFPEARFALWGDGPMRAELERLIHECGVESIVELSGRTVTPEAALRELDIFVLPSLSNEGTSNALLEAMATGLPVVATRVGGNALVVEDEVTGFVISPGDAPGLAAALIRLIEDDALAARLGRAARARVEADYGLDRLITRVEALYVDALERRAAA